MTQATRLSAFASAVGADIKALIAKIGDTTALNTTDRTSVVLAINEIVAALATANATLADKANQSLVTAALSGAGLESSGAYSADATTTYLKLATSLKNADRLIDTALKALADRVTEIEAGGSGVQIDDTAGDGATGVVWSADKTGDEIATARAALKDELLGGVGPAFDTLKELADALAQENDIIVQLTTKVGEKVSYAEAQTLTVAQKLQACQNIGIGDPETDLVAAYTAAKA